MLRSDFVVAVTGASDLREHLVDELVFATALDGRWTARCGTTVRSAALGVCPASVCRLCAESVRGRRR